jgi:ABC-type multidrug transport system ATPase subunit
VGLSLMGAPPVVLLDDPTRGLDVTSKQQVNVP